MLLEQSGIVGGRERPPLASAGECRKLLRLRRRSVPPGATSASASCSRDAGRSLSSWQREAIVGSTPPRSMAVNKNNTKGGGSSMVFSNRLPGLFRQLLGVEDQIHLVAPHHRPQLRIRLDELNVVGVIARRPGSAVADGFSEIRRRSGARRTTRTSG